MRALDGRFWMSWVGVAAMVVASGGLVACDDDDDAEVHGVDGRDPLWAIGNVDRRIQIVQENADDLAKA